MTLKTLRAGGAWSHGNVQSCRPAQDPKPRMADFLFLFRMAPDIRSKSRQMPSTMVMSLSSSPMATLEHAELLPDNFKMITE